MYIFMYDLISSDSRFVRKKLYGFYSDVLSDIDLDSMTNKEIKNELKHREFAKIISNNCMVLIFKKP